MNARQKAKYWKKRYEQIANMPLPNFTVTNYKIQTLKVKRICNAESEKVVELTETLMMRDFSLGISQFVKTEIEETPMGLEITKTLKVVDEK